MIDASGQMYPIPANYASKSKLVEGDGMKLTITDDGKFIYKQIAPVDRRTVKGVLIQEDGQYKVLVEGTGKKPQATSTVKTHYAVVDGVVGMEGHGPIMGAAKPAGVLVMGAGPLSVDAVAARVMGVDPARVEHLALARRARLGALDPEDIEVALEALLSEALGDQERGPRFPRVRPRRVERGSLVQLVHFVVGLGPAHRGDDKLPYHQAIDARTVR